MTNLKQKNVSEQIKERLEFLKPDLRHGDYNTIKSMTGILKADISRVFKGELSKTDKPVRVLKAVEKIVRNYQKQIS